MSPTPEKKVYGYRFTVNSFSTQGIQATHPVFLESIKRNGHPIDHSEIFRSKENKGQANNA